MLRKKVKESNIIENIVSILWPEFVEAQSGLVFIKRNLCQESNLENSKDADNHYFDKTDEESFVNHIHLDDEIDVRRKENIAQLGKVVGEVWSLKLKKDFPNRHFRIYLTLNDGTIIRFHQKHENEPNWLNESDWREEIENGKVFIWEV